MISKRARGLCLSASILLALGVGLEVAATTFSPERYNVVWDSPSKDQHGSMPLGNGSTGLNAWIEPNGDLVFYISRTDSWGDNGRLLKVGRVRISLNPAPSTGDFLQTLSLVDGTLKARCGETDIRLWVDANHSVVHAELNGPNATEATAAIELWRTKQESIPSSWECSDVHLFRPRPGEKWGKLGPTVMEPDNVLRNEEGRIGWYHRNIKSVGPAMHAKIQGVDGFERLDPLLHRTFGAIIKAENAKRVDDTHLLSPQSKSHRFDVYVHTEHPATEAEWGTATEQVIANTEAIAFGKRRADHEAWWIAFWNRSWIHVEGAKGPANGAFVVSRAYALQRYINACGGRGAYPIKFNGSIFTVEGIENEKSRGPDYRRWGPGYWWQNTRLPYISMLTSGDEEMTAPLYKMYCQDLFDYHKYRTRMHTGHGGIYVPECMYFWGEMFAETYGKVPCAEREDKLQDNRYHKWEWVSGLEMSFMMLDRYEHTLDEAFLKETTIPFATEILTFFVEHYDTDEDGKLVMHPAQALETWWECTNPMDPVAGMLAVTDRLLALPEGVSTPALRTFWTQVKAKIPELPTREYKGETIFAPAEKFDMCKNGENPELYCVFPFRLSSFEKTNAEMGRRTLFHRAARGNHGWRQDEIFMAYLGLADEARNHLVDRARNHHKGSRFPAFWGPNFDWIPDQDHGGVLMKALQSMLLQTDGKKIYLMPAWPKDWNAAFKLHAPYKTVIEGRVEDGKMIDLKVSPESRREDVILAALMDCPSGEAVDSTAGAPRIRENFCDGWQFHLGEVQGAEKPELDDSAWRTLDVPHDWSIEQKLDPKAFGGGSVGYLPGGVGWYRKTFTMPKAAEGKQVVIDFDGVYMNSKVWINGHLLGFRPFGYVSFRYDLTPHLNFGGENVMAVQVDVKPGCSRWYPGAGIYRRVWMTTMAPIHVAHWGHFVTTPEVSKEKGSVRLRTEIENKTGKDATVTLRSVVLNPQGQQVANASSMHEIAPGVMHEFDQQFVVTNPLFWSPDRPDLYEVVSTVEAAGKVQDEVTAPLGIRTFEFTKDRGLIFNGEKMDVKGVCLHQDFGPLGVAFHPRAMERRLEIMREMGCNAIRTSHNPRDPEFYALCDRMGFLVMDEVFDEWKIPKLWSNQAYALYFDEWSERDLTSIVRRDRNHPSVVMWSIGNEINEQYKPHGGEMSARLASIVKQHDTSRPITAGCNSPSHAQNNGFDKALDVFGLNYSYQVYNELKGKRAMIGTENSTDWSARGSYSYYRPLRGDLEIQHFKNDLELSSYGIYRERDADLTLRTMRASPWVAGQFAWTGFDYRGEAHPLKWPVHTAFWGIVDLVGFPKDQYYLYQSDWSDKPMVHIVPQHWNWSQYPGGTIPVWVYSNCDEVELFQNNKSLGIKTIDREETLRFEWGVKYRPGTLKAVGWKNGQQVCSQSVSTSDEPAKIALAPDRTEIAADGADLSYIEVRVLDHLGRLCPDADRNLIRFDVSGAGEIVGVCNGSSHSHDAPKGKTVHAFRGLCMVVVKSRKSAGTIEVKATSEGLQGMNVQLQALPVDSPKLAQAAADRERAVREQNKTFSRHRLAVLSMKDGRPAGKPMDLKALAEEQKELAAYAAQEFPSISLTPTVHLCASLKKLGVTVRPEGTGWGQMKNVLGRKDWLLALSLLNPEVKEKYPNRRELDRLLHELKNMRYTLNLQPQFDIPQGKTLYYIFKTEGENMHIAEGWYLQSGHGGWTHWWVPDNKEVFVVLADKGDAATKTLGAIHQAYLKDVKLRSDKHSQGEFSDAQFHHECSRLAEKQHADYIELMSKY